MRTPRGTPGASLLHLVSRARRVIPVALVALGVAGCGALRAIGNPDVNGFGEQDERLRTELVTGGFAKAYASLEKAAPRDPLLNHLYTGIVAHYAGEYEASSAALEQAAELAEARAATSSISRAAFSTISSDLTLVYEPAEAERLLVHYFHAMNYLRRGMPDEAAVEARRLSKLLETYEDDGVARGLVQAPLLRAFAASVFAAAGDENAAAVSWRQAASLLEDSSWIAEAVPDSLGTVIVFIEAGFVPHRAEQSLNIFLNSEDVDLFDNGDAEARSARAADISARVLAEAFGERPRYGYEHAPSNIVVTAPPPSRSYRCERDRDNPEKSKDKPRRATERGPRSAVPIRTRDAVAPPVDSRADSAHAGSADAALASVSADHSRCGDDDDDDDEDDAVPYLLRLAWPAFVGHAPPARTSAVTSGDAEAGVLLRADIGDAVVGDFESRRAQLMARTIARAIAKLALSKSVEKEVSKKNADIGKLFGMLTNASGAVLERADTRSWHLLPGSLAMSRLQLPAGTHDVAVRIGTGVDSRIVHVGTVIVERGRTQVLSTRVWQ